MDQPSPLRPIIGVGTVIFRDHSVLLVRRRQPPKAGEWSLPGGRQEWGESVAQAAVREITEETGVKVTLLGLVDVVDLLPDAGAPYHLTLINLAARWTMGEPAAGDDAADARFWPLDALPGTDLWDETRRVIHKARALFPAAHDLGAGPAEPLGAPPAPSEASGEAAPSSRKDRP
ncbi:8-oxo-dGTP diphosphatase [Rhodothalassium salexigens DSM 2132]|uniref:8-oxo-dGTP diphosphatase n=1 Tax=Rhodothalassium salexigens DSM 2132 TaxID=1188247 RepID=A0A4R2PRP5_RHOSA|nr:NUDIX domain-containing protein [Rhodothalassium salexigens]MBB4210398.1 8-oxo-dGTP diphosphatase [Rhodothalassium salexigens DSM 2132]MBK1638599.1 hypothetical protein [Rhodothalassium salexigens DSM 2132]TCP38562.1 8-oxo-dGTP diphosphatase [Rhodothalassium salexigens DSM 2132]